MNLLNGLGGDSGFGEEYLSRNDDQYSPPIDLTTIFGLGGLTFFGVNYTTLVINNNGTVVFGDEGDASYTPWAMQTGGKPSMIAAYFADVDTQGFDNNIDGPGAVTPTAGGTSTGSNLVWYDMDSTGLGALTITWDDVGFYSQNTTLLNAFQLRLIGKGNGNFDVEFRYESINWTTGDLSGGTDGLGGNAARVGFSAGDGTNFFELPQTGSQDLLLSLDSTTGNTGVTGYYKYSLASAGDTGGVLNGTSLDDFLVGGNGNDTINGLAGNDLLDGQGGSNILVGGSGHDIYVVRSSLDSVVETANAGNDTVQTDISFSLAALSNVENITLTGLDDVDATGNAQNNVFIGNQGSNTLDGGGGC